MSTDLTITPGTEQHPEPLQLKRDSNGSYHSKILPCGTIWFGQMRGPSPVRLLAHRADKRARTRMIMVAAGTFPLAAIGRPVMSTGMRRGLPRPVRGFDGDVGWKASRCAILWPPAGRRHRCRRCTSTWTCITRVAIETEAGRLDQSFSGRFWEVVTHPYRFTLSAQ